jgi:hypothetical protein
MVKNSDDLNEIIAGQLDILTGGKATPEDCQRTNAITGMIDKQLKKDGLRLTYYAQRKTVPPLIEVFSNREEIKRAKRA